MVFRVGYNHIPNAEKRRFFCSLIINSVYTNTHAYVRRKKLSLKKHFFIDDKINLSQITKLNESLKFQTTICRCIDI